MQIPRFAPGLFVVVLAVLTLFGALVCYAQSDNASISGRVTDPSGAVVVGAEIQLQSADRGTAETTATNENGIYVFPFVRPGLYNITVRKSGFRQIDYVGLTANTQDHIEQNFNLTLGAASESMTVTAEANRIETSGAAATSVDQIMVDSMPLNGRTFQSLIGITPGATRTGGAGLFSFNGQRDNSNYFTIDGVSANVGVNQVQGAALGQAGAGQAPTLSAINTTSSMLPLDALQEIKIQTSSYAAEFGRSAGGQIAITTRGGSNEYHGSLYDNLRNDAFDAWNPYLKWLNVQPGSVFEPKPELRLNLFGGTLGGPLDIPGLYNGKDKTFFFVSYEGLRMRQPTGGYTDVPPDSVRQGTTASGLPIFPGLLAYLTLTPTPNGTDPISYGPAFFASYSNPSSTNATSVRIDEKIGDKITLFGRVGYSPSHENTRSIYSINEVDTIDKTNKNVTLGAAVVLTPHLIDEIHANWTKSGGDGFSTLDNFDGSTVPTQSMYNAMFPTQYGASTKNSLFVFEASAPYGTNGGYWGTGWQVGHVVANTQRQINLIDDINWLQGKHSFKFGVDWRYLFPIAAPQVYSPSIAYYDDADLSSGLATVGSVESNDVVVVHQHDTALFAQDTWHITPQLTLDYGIRWDYDPAPYAVDGQSLYVVSNPLDPTSATLSPAGTPMYPAKKNQFVPRIGGAYEWSTKPGWEGLLRGGFGIFYVSSADTALQATNYYPHARYAALYGTNWMTNPLPPAPAVTGQPPYTDQNVLGYYPGFTTPRTYEWNFAIQQALGSAQNLTVGYVGSAGRELTRMSQFAGSSYDNQFLYLTLYGSQDTSDYNALQVSFIRRVRKGLMVLANYTWAKSFDTASDDTAISPAPSEVNVAHERGLSSFDVRNALNISFDYDIPTVSTSNKFTRAVLGGWSLGGIFMAHSGNPLTVTFDQLLANGSTTAYRPDITGQPVWTKSPSEFGRRVLNPAAFDYTFAIDGSGRAQGDEPRGYFSSPGLSEFEFSVKRQIKITEHVGLNYSAEFFNLFNHVNYAPPNTQWGQVYTDPITNNLAFSQNTNFGLIQSTLGDTTAGGGMFGVGGARSIQMALRLQF
jgi:hypothetical protein